MTELTTKELEILFPNTEIIQIAGLKKKYTIRPFNINQTEVAVNELGALIPVIMKLFADGEVEEIDVGTMIGMFNESIGGLKRLVAMCIDEDVDSFVGQLDTATFITITTSIIHVNKAFFLDNLTKAIQASTKELIPNTPSVN
jgi:hypothetical protein